MSESDRASPPSSEEVTNAGTAQAETVERSHRREGHVADDYSFIRSIVREELKRAQVSALAQERPVSEYERVALSYQRTGFWVQLLATIAALSSLVFLGLQVREQTKATQAQTAATEAQYSALESSVYQDLMSKQLDLHKLFIDKPDAYDYINGKYREPSISAPPYVIGILDYQLDFFQLIFSQRPMLPELEDESGSSWTSWKNTMRDAFKRSPRLCEQFDENHEQYGQDFVQYVFDTNKWCSRAKSRNGTPR